MNISYPGIAFMAYHIAEKDIRLSEGILDCETLFSIADKDLVRVLRQNPINPAHIHSSRHTRLSFIETQLGIATLVLARNHITSEQVIIDSSQAAKEYLELAVQVAVSPASSDDIQNQDDGCEILYGRAGLLYALLYLRKVLRGDYPDAHSAVVQGPLEILASDINVSCLIESVITRGKHGSQILSTDLRSCDTSSLPPLMWKWHGKRYLGGAHGVGRFFLFECWVVIHFSFRFADSGHSADYLELPIPPLPDTPTGYHTYDPLAC